MRQLFLVSISFTCIHVKISSLLLGVLFGFLHTLCTYIVYSFSIFTDTRPVVETVTSQLELVTEHLVEVL